MVNALLWNLLLTFHKREEVNLVFEYVEQLHFLHGFETIFLSEDAFNRMKRGRSHIPDYLRKLPNSTRNQDKQLEKIKHELDSILWKLKKTDHLEAQLDSFVSIYSKWVQALSLDAVVALPMMVTTDSVSHFFHILVGDKRDFIDPLADDLELWFLSLFANVFIRWPYYLNFSNQMKEVLSTQFDFDKFKDLRTKICIYPTNNQAEQERNDMLLQAQEFNRLITEFSKTSYPENIIFTRAAIGVSNENLLAFERLSWHYPKLMKILREPILGKGFVSCFVPDKLYSLEIIRRVKPLGSLANTTNPLNYYATFELICDLNMDLALENFKKRFDIKRTS